MVGGADKPTRESALAYLQTVKYKFRYQREKYDEFIEILTDYRCRRVNFPDVRRRVIELFKGDQELLEGFNAFLPKGLDITLQPEDGQYPLKKSVKFEDAYKFVKTVKRTFQGDDRYKIFLDILKRYREGMPFTEVYREAAVLFRDHKDLLAEFNHLMCGESGDNSPTSPTHSVTGSTSW